MRKIVTRGAPVKRDDRHPDAVPSALRGRRRMHVRERGRADTMSSEERSLQKTVPHERLPMKPATALTIMQRLTSTLLEQLESASVLDRVVLPLADKVRASLATKPLAADVLHGVPAGHPVHPALVLLPAGAFLSAGVLDAVPGTGTAAPVLIGLGMASSVPAMAAGLADWSRLHPQQQRVGLVHAGANGAALVLYAASLSARLRGNRTRGKAYGWAGLAAVSAGGYLGGHLAYHQAAGANHAEHVAHVLPAGWHEMGPLSDLPDGRPVRRLLGEVPVLLLRRGPSVSALADACSHLSGPLHEGELSDVDGETCIACPWHGSVFRLHDGAVVHGPATAAQPAFATRVVGGQVGVSLRNADG